MTYSNITFFIGNGFDMRQGLATGYEDFYENRLKGLSNDQGNFLIRRIKDDEGIGLWADLEFQLGAT